MYRAFESILFKVDNISNMLCLYLARWSKGRAFVLWYYSQVEQGFVCLLFFCCVMLLLCILQKAFALPASPTVQDVWGDDNTTDPGLQEFKAKEEVLILGTCRFRCYLININIMFGVMNLYSN